ncbi:MAG: NirA family protein [Planctomycetota bacterium]
MSENAFSEAQKQYLAGLAMGADVARAAQGLPVLANSAGGSGETVQIGGNNPNHPLAPEHIAYEAQTSTKTGGSKLCKEEVAKSEKNPLDMWDEIAARANKGEFPKGTDVFLTKFHGLFYVAPAQDSYMCRLRIPGGEIQDYQLSGLADLADASAGGFIDVTTRANLQLREIPADHAMNILYGVRALNLVSLGSGGDNIRNVTASPLSGFDPEELIETLPIAHRMHHFILNHREMYGLPRKFNIAFDGGGKISALDDTNDIGFHAVRLVDTEQVVFLLTLGGITGHKDFARETGVYVMPSEVESVAGAIVRVFVKNGDRTDRKKARLKYVLDDWGFDKFIAAVEEELGHPLSRLSESQFERAEVEDRMAHVDFHDQKQTDKRYVGVVLPVGRITTDQARGLAAIARKYGSGKIRLTVWQNLLIPDIDVADCEAVGNELLDLGLEYSANSYRAGLVACTGNAGCKFAASNTKGHAMQIAEYLESKIELDQPINIHLTGCHHSCAQHYIGDIGLIGTKVEVGDEMVEGYDLYVGGGWGSRQQIARLLRPGVTSTDVPLLLESVIHNYMSSREPGESFSNFVQGLADDQLPQLLSDSGVLESQAAS